MAYTAEQLRKLKSSGHAMAPAASTDSDSPRFPIANQKDLQNAIRAAGGRTQGPADAAKVRRYIMSRARALNLDSLIPDSWASDGTLKG